MTQAALAIRPARPRDATAIAAVHDAAWREAYRGIIPALDLERMIERRGPRWWRTAIERGSRLAVLDFEERIGGYVTYGRNRLAASPYRGEIFELYLAPEFQGLGFGRRLFEAARRDLAAHRLPGLLIWALADNERAVGFYQRLGGRRVRAMEDRFGAETRERIAFAWP